MNIETQSEPKAPAEDLTRKVLVAITCSASVDAGKVGEQLKQFQSSPNTWEMVERFFNEHMKKTQTGYYIAAPKTNDPAALAFCALLETMAAYVWLALLETRGAK